MNLEEHMLVLLLFNKQREAIWILLEMLKSRGVLTGDDEQAFSSLWRQDFASMLAVLRESKAAYLALAKETGISPELLQSLDATVARWLQEQE